ncbi:MAG: sigma factor-like helix-turn-helix DNA-binding protein [Culicoidibacterales bacterium]
MQTVCTELNANLNELVTTYFHDKKYRLFREFCFKFQIVTLAEINQEVLDRFSKQLGVGKTKSARIQAIYENKFPVQTTFTEQTVQPMETALPTNLAIEEIQKIHIAIHEAFSETHFKMIVNFCRANDVAYVSDLTVTVLRKIRRLSGMGPKKYRYLFERLELLHTQLTQAQFEVESGIFEQVRDHRVDHLIAKFGLAGYESFPKMTVAELQGRLVKEVVELEKSHSVMVLNRYLTNPKTTISSALAKLNEQEQKILVMHEAGEANIHQLSEEFEISPDRIVQIEKRMKQHLAETFEKYQILQLLAILDDNNQEVSDSYLKENLGEYQTLIKQMMFEQ